jgi:hypothetical protein
VLRLRTSNEMLGWLTEVVYLMFSVWQFSSGFSQGTTSPTSSQTAAPTLAPTSTQVRPCML